MPKPACVILFLLFGTCLQLFAQSLVDELDVAWKGKDYGRIAGVIQSSLVAGQNNLCGNTANAMYSAFVLFDFESATNQLAQIRSRLKKFEGLTGNSIETTFEETLSNVMIAAGSMRTAKELFLIDGEMPAEAELEAIRQELFPEGFPGRDLLREIEKAEKSEQGNTAYPKPANGLLENTQSD